MSTVQARRYLRENVAEATVAFTVVGYALVIGTFTLDLPYPTLSEFQIDVLTHAIALINAAATTALVLGWYWIRRGDVDKHRAAMVSAFVLIVLFLVVYLFRVGGGETKILDVDPGVVQMSYQLMLAVHILLSIVAVPVVLYALLLGMTHTPTELRETVHAKVGRLAASVWILSLVLGIVTYVMLNHVYGWTY